MPAKQLEIKIAEGDAPVFIHLVQEIINRIAVRDDVAEIRVIRIKNWFDHKWLNYSGKSIIHFEHTTHPDRIALENTWNERITVPPFNPNRILSEGVFMRSGPKNKKKGETIHDWQRSTANQNNQIKGKVANGLFIWYSSDTIKNQQGSIMSYRVDKDNVDTWYASAENKNGWKVTKTKGINLDELADLGK